MQVHFQSSQKLLIGFRRIAILQITEGKERRLKAYPHRCAGHNQDMSTVTDIVLHKTSAFVSREQVLGRIILFTFATSALFLDKRTQADLRIHSYFKSLVIGRSCSRKSVLSY